MSIQRLLEISPVELMPLVIALFYIPFIFYTVKKVRKVGTLKTFYKAVLSTLERVSDDDAAIQQIKIIYRRMSDRVPSAFYSSQSITLCLEDMLTRSEIAEAKVSNIFHAIVGLRPCPIFPLYIASEIKNRIAKIIFMSKEQEPFSNVSGRSGHSLTAINGAIQSTNIELAMTNLRQLAADIEMLESSLKSKERNIFVSYIISVVGVIFTLLFGVLSYIK